MIIKAASIILLIISQIQLLGQDNYIQGIKDYYTQVTEAIKICQSSDEVDKMDCGFYKTELMVNPDAIAWRGSGSFSRKIEIWFDDDPKYCDECGKDGVGVVKKIIMDERSALNKYHYEFLYKNGKLIFHYEQQAVVGYDGEEKKKEYRYYIDEIGLGRYVDDQKTYDRGEIEQPVFEKVEKIKERGSDFLELFLLTLK